MCEPVTLGLIGSYLGGTAAMGAGATTAFGAAAQMAAGALAGGVAGSAVGKEGQKQVSSLLTPDTPNPVAQLNPRKAPKPGVGTAGKTSRGIPGGQGSTILTGSRGATPSDSLLGGTTLLGG